MTESEKKPILSWVKKAEVKVSKQVDNESGATRKIGGDLNSIVDEVSIEQVKLDV